MDQSIEQLARDLAFAGYAKSTQQGYIATVTELSDRIRKPLAEAIRDDLREFMEALLTRGRSPGWVNWKLRALKEVDPVLQQGVLPLLAEGPEAARGRRGRSDRRRLRAGRPGDTDGAEGAGAQRRAEADVRRAHGKAY